MKPQLIITRMGLKAIYKTRDEIPEGVADHYKELADGTFKIDLDGGVKTQDEVKRLENAIDNERTQRIDTQKELDKYKDVDLEKWEKVKDIDPDAPPTSGNESEEAIQKKYQDKFREWKEEETKKHKEELDAAKEEANSATEKAKNTVKENWQRKMLSEKFGFTDPRKLNALMLEVKHGSDPDFSEIRKELETIEVESNGDVFKVVGGNVRDEKGAVEALEKISSTDIAKFYKPASDNSGGGAGNNGHAGNKSEVSKLKKGDGTLNRTEAGRLYRENPDKAKSLVRQAGFDPAKVFQE